MHLNYTALLSIWLYSSIYCIYTFENSGLSNISLHCIFNDRTMCHTFVNFLMMGDPLGTFPEYWPVSSYVQAMFLENRIHLVSIVIDSYPANRNRVSPFTYSNMTTAASSTRCTLTLKLFRFILIGLLLTTCDPVSPDSATGNDDPVVIVSNSDGMGVRLENGYVVFHVLGSLCGRISRLWQGPGRQRQRLRRLGRWRARWKTGDFHSFQPRLDRRLGKQGPNNCRPKRLLGLWRRVTTSIIYSQRVYRWRSVSGLYVRYVCRYKPGNYKLQKSGAGKYATDRSPLSDRNGIHWRHSFHES